jgi:hypothetical protein
MAKRRKSKGKRKGGKKRKAQRKGTSRRGPISYTPCRDSKGMFRAKTSCRV